MRIVCCRGARGTGGGGRCVRPASGAWPLEPEMKLSEAAEIMGISTARAQQLERAAIRKILRGIRDAPGLEDEWRSIAGQRER